MITSNCTEAFHIRIFFIECKILVILKTFICCTYRLFLKVNKVCRLTCCVFALELVNNFCSQVWGMYVFRHYLCPGPCSIQPWEKESDTSLVLIFERVKHLPEKQVCTANVDITVYTSNF